MEFLAQSYRSQSTTYHLAAQQLAIRLHAAGRTKIRRPWVSAIGASSRRATKVMLPDLILSRDGKNNLWLPVGTVHGVTLGSHIACMRPGLRIGAPLTRTGQMPR